MFGINQETTTKLKSFIIECKRVFKVTKKPTMEEFKMVSKVSAIGAGIIGLMGFLVNVIYQLLS
jgi:protein transport protein SEC61 subunit gamma-like protein